MNNLLTHVSVTSWQSVAFVCITWFYCAICNFST